MFNSRNPVFRNPTGSVANGTNIHFKITLPRYLQCSAANLRLANETSAQKYNCSMFWCGMNGDDAEWWECDFTPPDPGLYFYHFTLQTCEGNVALSRAWGGEAELFRGHSCNKWQLTVYDCNFQPPDWMAGGIMYQIFPDRFYNSGTPKEGVPADRKLHRVWGEEPDWQPNEQGKITNSDYFCGDLQGIVEKLDYLKSLHVSCIYLNPIFEAHSNHRYDTADYSKIDPLLGTEEDFCTLCRKAKACGIRIILDGVFSHTGSDSIYFNREGRYPSQGAYQSKESPYYSWYAFQNWPDEYYSWWGFTTLPNVDETNPDFNRYINGENGIVRHWLKAGAAGWRLDVADELPDLFIDRLRTAARAEKEDALILGEVWEDATNKFAYGVRRRYFLGEQLDSVMNYPFREAILGFLCGKNPADMMELILTILENYPKPVLDVLMNHIGTHDTERAVTILGGEPLNGRDRNWQYNTKLSPAQWETGLRRLRLAALMQYTLPGVPCIYYGDEAGMEGYRDPFNRACYPWGHENSSLLGWYRQLGELRASLPMLAHGAFSAVFAQNSVMAYTRQDSSGILLVAVNASSTEQAVPLGPIWAQAASLLGNAPTADGHLPLSAFGCALLLRQIEPGDNKNFKKQG